MQMLGTVRNCSLTLNSKVLGQSREELFFCHAIQILHHTIVIQNSELTGRETNSHKVIVLLITLMIWIVLCLFSSYKSSSSTPMVSICNIQIRNLSKSIRNGGNVSGIFYQPELMTESIYWSNKIILSLSCCYTFNQRIERCIIGIGKENWLQVGIINTDMTHTVFLFVTTSQFMLLDNTVHVILHGSCNNQSILSLATHSLRIDVVHLLLILNKPSFLLELSKVLSSTCINALVIFAGADREINLRLNDVIE